MRKKILMILLIAAVLYGGSELGACDLSTVKDLLELSSLDLSSLNSSPADVLAVDATSESAGSFSEPLPAATKAEEDAVLPETEGSSSQTQPVDSDPSSDEPTTSNAATSSMSTTVSSKETSSTSSASQRIVLEPTEAQLRYIEERFYELVCLERAVLGVGDLENPDDLNKCARIRANEIVTNYSHTRPNGNNFYSVMKENHYREGTLYASGEIIGMSFHVNEWQGTMPGFTGSKEQLDYVANCLFQGFKGSPPHYKIMIDKDYKDTGVGVNYEVLNAADPETKFICFFCAGLFTT